MLLIITNSTDVTTDLIIHELRQVEHFRFNIDQWTQYKWWVSGNDFLLEDQQGRFVDERRLGAVYLRKAIFPEGRGKDQETIWCSNEVERTFEDLYHGWHSKGKLVLIHPGNGKWHKIQQMRLAERYFKVPEWHIVRGQRPDLDECGEWVVKTQTQEPVTKDKYLFVKSADPRKLDPAYPWFIQRRVEAEEDVTAVYVEGRVFAYSLARTTFKGEDYRPYAPFVELPWESTQLSDVAISGIRSFMKDTGYSFGRFDFLRAGGELHFLEMNPNGQWAWLEKPGVENGLFASIVGVLERKCRGIE